LESVVTVEDKNILTIKERAYELGAITAQMTGSGSTVFALCDDLATAISVYEGLKPASSKVFLTHTTPDSLTIYG
ncbi:MAG: hypothetical protein RBR58_03320, partial [Candidatus Humimicrobiaceae bacterium]|nr:hypothetical protein [Candidatus Humimicrobiaceae bacterium]